MRIPIDNMSDPPVAFYRLNDLNCDADQVSAIVTTDLSLRIISASHGFSKSVELLNLVGLNLSSFISSYLHPSHESDPVQFILHHNHTIITMKSHLNNQYHASIKIQQSQSTYTWFFSDLIQYSTTLSIQNGMISGLIGDFEPIFGWEQRDITNQPLRFLLPNILNLKDTIHKKDMDTNSEFIFTCGINRNKQYIPLFLSIKDNQQSAINSPEVLNNNSITIFTSVELTGFIILDTDLKVQSMNHCLSLSLFGDYNIVGLQIQDYIPKIKECLDRLTLSHKETSTQNLDLDQSIHSNSIYKHSHIHLNQSHVCCNLKTCRVIAKHIDQSEFEFSLHCRIWNTDSEMLKDGYALWIHYVLETPKKLTKEEIEFNLSTTEEFKSTKPNFLSISTQTVDTVTLTKSNTNNGYYQNILPDLTTADPSSNHLSIKTPVSGHSLHTSLSIKSPSSAHSKTSTSHTFIGKLHLIDTPANECLLKDLPPKANPIYVKPPIPMSLIERSSHQIEDFTVISALGEGAYSFVKLCHHNYDNSKIPLVVKYVVRSRILTWCRRPDLGNRVPNEIAILHDLSKSPHPHLPHLQTFFSDSFFYYLIFDHHPTKDLFEFIEQNSFINDDTIRVIFKQLLVAIEYIHSVGIVHRDIKDENVLIDDSFHVTLIDFGSAAYCSSAPFKSFFGTTLYAAPEVLKGLSYEGKPQDMWQLGVLLYTLKFHENPYFTVDEILSNQTLKYPGLIHGDLIDLLNGLLDRNVDTRFEITKVLDHPWFQF